jgi:hypothetical protein
MRRREEGSLVVVSFVLLIAAAAAMSYYDQGPQNSSAVRMATGYLAANYDRGVGLVSETPHGHTFFVYSDNFLAAYVLERSGNSTLRAIAANITATDDRYLAELRDPGNQYEVLASSSGTFFASDNYVLSREEAAVVETTLNNGTSTLSPASYADLAFLEALYFHQVGYNRDAVSEFDLGVKLYDGVGFKDQAYAGQYQTYKLALYEYVGKVLGIGVPPQVQTDLLKMQAPGGGFYTGYTSDFSPDGSTTNTETTSLAVLALSAQPHASFLPVYLCAIAAVVLVEAVVMRERWRRQRSLSDTLRV